MCFFFLGNRSCVTTCDNITWIQNGTTILRHTYNKSDLFYDYVGLYMDDDEVIYVADFSRNEIQEWSCSARCYTVRYINNEDDKTHQLNHPTDVLLDREDKDSLIICDRSNNRVIRWSRITHKYDETIIKNIECWGLAMDEEGYLYVSDTRNHIVRRYRIDEKNKTIVAGNNEIGYRLNQLNFPTFIFVDENQSIYISDSGNHRVVKWEKNAKQGIIVAGSHKAGNASTQLSNPRGLFVDSLGTLYVVDTNNHRVMRWCKGAMVGTVIIGGIGPGNHSNQLNNPQGITFDKHRNLYVADSKNYRIQQFKINLN